MAGATLQDEWSAPNLELFILNHLSTMLINNSENTFPPLTKKEIKDLKVLLQFTSVYCKVKHGGDKTLIVTEEPEFQKLPLAKYPVCKECSDFLLYAFERRLRCPLEEKPLCKHCPVHCYKPAYRDKVREIMRFSGQHLIKRGRLDLLWHYFF